jgi:VWFA-related protein
MKKLVLLITAYSLSFSHPQLLSAKQQPAQAPTVSVTTTAVEVDVIVRDGKGNPVHDLTAEDFELAEDGVRQKIGSFRVVSRERGFAVLNTRATTDANAAPGPAELESPGVLALVFDRLEPESRARAYRSATNYLKSGKLPGDRIGVFSIDLTLRTLQSYTDDPLAIRQALEGAGTQTGPLKQANSTRVRELIGRTEQLERTQRAGTEIAAQAGPGNADAATSGSAMIGGAAVDQLMDAMEIRMAQQYDALERDERGHGTTNGLLAIVHAMRLLPGRKTIVFFSDGLSLPPAVLDRFRAVIDLANRSNVSIYAMDAGGLRAESTLDEMKRDLDAVTRERLRQLAAGGGGAANNAMMKALERNEDLLRSNPHASLGQIAEETGGFLIRDTNDLRAGFRRIDEDMRFHYLLTYVPANEEYNGQWRQIGVKVRRPGVEVRARRGYYAVRTPSAIMPYEAPAVALLDSPKLPNAFPVRVAALSFPEDKRPGLVPVMVQVGTERLTFRREDGKDLYMSDFTILARFKDAKGDVVRKVSQQYVLRGPIAQLEQAKRGTVLFYKDPELTPGVYTLEAVVYDALSGGASARLSTVEVPKLAEQSLRVSSLTIVRRSEKVPEKERDASNPFYYGELLLYPNLGEPLRKTVDKELSFFLTVYPARGTERPQATIELLLGGRSLGAVPTELTAPDALGRIQHVGRLPLEKFPIGSYDLKITVKDGKTQQARSAHFTVAE